MAGFYCNITRNLRFIKIIFYWIDMTKKEQEISCSILPNKPLTVKDITEFEVRGPWVTKSDAELQVLFSLPYTEVLKYLEYDEKELEIIQKDIRGLRSYTVRNLNRGSKGGREFHRVRKEIIFGLEGYVSFELEDFYKGKRHISLDSHKGICIPPFILHTYEAMKNNSGLLIIANTLFDPDNHKTHDTFSEKIFREIQEQYK